MLDKTVYYSIKTKFGQLKVSKVFLTMMKGEINNDMYTLIGKIVIGEASHIENQQLEKVKLWHLRLCHIGQKGLIELEKQRVLEKGSLGRITIL